MNYENQISLVQAYLTQLSGFLGFQEEEFRTLITRIHNRHLQYPGGKICITGVGKNASLAMKASETFASLGLRSAYLNTSHLSHGDFGFIGDEDIVIHLSRSGQTIEMLSAAAHLDKIKPNVVQVLLTCQPIEFFLNSFNHRIFDWIIYTGKVTEIDLHALAPTTSTTILLTLLDLIGTQLSEKIGFTREDFLKYHPGGALGAMLREEAA